MTSEKHMPTVLILGGTSDLGVCMAREFLRRGWRPVLAGRNEEMLRQAARDLETRCGITIPLIAYNAEDFAAHPELPEQCRAVIGRLPEGVVSCVGLLPDPDSVRCDSELARTCLNANLTGIITSLDPFVELFEQRRAGFLGVVTSVAGDRGRKSNYHYAAAKAGLDVYLQGLRHRLHGSGVTVTTVKPGYLQTKMISGMSLPRALITAPEKAAVQAVNAILNGRRVVYVPFWWRLIMLAVRIIPEPLFVRTNI
ncbi:MAG TPA: SDR family NAD(P)-dependent oxidoreductase [Candidatus Hydrogenedentes bacterium]|nr:SDR family NAD(P)-dependent oxidoreductase [Candidatus Hydrogenedentota bacterium]HPU96389.1 SDR family NAD(P)-dependent oxidoreductase [Candidatus Hydrogenedentota bacterium]